ncbi:MAG: hypothetical protein J0L62_09655 [Bacteroidetes bacterium]|nr:hypothetical protein [Bacteroidota bacterium]
MKAILFVCLCLFSGCFANKNEINLKDYFNQFAVRKDAVLVSFYEFGDPKIKKTAHIEDFIFESKNKIIEDNYSELGDSLVLIHAKWKFTFGIDSLVINRKKERNIGYLIFRFEKENLVILEKNDTGTKKLIHLPWVVENRFKIKLDENDRFSFIVTLDSLVIGGLKYDNLLKFSAVTSEGNDFIWISKEMGVIKYQTTIRGHDENDTEVLITAFNENVLKTAQ